MTKTSYKKLITKMLRKATASGLSYAKIVSNFKRDHPTQCRKTFIRRALEKSLFKLSRKKYILAKEKRKRAKRIRLRKLVSTLPVAAAAVVPVFVTSPAAPVAPVAAHVPRAPVFDNSTVVAPLVPAAPGETVPHWQYSHDGWKNYDKAASDVVEAAYQEWKANPYTDVRAIKSGEWQYTVDFNTMMQQNIVHQNHTSRAIRRTMVALPTVEPTVSSAAPS